MVSGRPRPSPDTMRRVCPKITEHDNTGNMATRGTWATEVKIALETTFYSLRRGNHDAKPDPSLRTSITMHFMQTCDVNVCSDVCMMYISIMYILCKC